MPTGLLIIGKKKDVIYVCHDGQKWKCDSKSTIDGGLFGGGLTSFYDLSITKNVTTMIFTVGMRIAGGTALVTF